MVHIILNKKIILILNHICLDLLTLLASPTHIICFNMRQGWSTDFSMWYIYHEFQVSMFMVRSLCSGDCQTVFVYCFYCRYKYLSLFCHFCMDDLIVYSNNMVLIVCFTNKILINFWNYYCIPSNLVISWNTVVCLS